MPPRSPLPSRHGLSAAWLRTPDRDRARPEPWPMMGAWLRHRLSERVDVARMLADERFVYEDLLVADAQPAAPDTPAEEAGTGPGGHCGATQESSAVDLPPHIDPSDQPLPGPAQPTRQPSAALRKSPRKKTPQPAG